MDTERGNDPFDWIDEALWDLEEQGLLRRRIVRGSPQGALIRIDGQEYLNFGSNDYLSLANHPQVITAAQEALQREGVGSGASPLINGRGAAHRALEEELAEFLGCEKVLLFASGYAANVGTISALVGREDAVFSDEFNHASIIDGCRLSRAAVHIYAHGNVADLERQLATCQARRKLIVTDGLFSMMGDVAPLAEIVHAAARHQVMLMVDEAHALGVLGEKGRGACELAGVADRVPVRMGTFGKALGSQGSFVAGSGKLIEWLANRARSQFFSTASLPAAAAAASAALKIVRTEPRRRDHIRQLAEYFRTRLRSEGWRTSRDATGPIVAVIQGDSADAMRLAEALRESGIFVPGIRPPSVPVGGALLRFSLCYQHTEEMLDQVLKAMRTYRGANFPV